MRSETSAESMATVPPSPHPSLGVLGWYYLVPFHKIILRIGFRSARWIVNTKRGPKCTSHLTGQPCQELRLIWAFAYYCTPLPPGCSSTNIHNLFRSAKTAEAVGLAASVIAIMELSAKFAKIWVKYSSAVKAASNDISLEEEISEIAIITKKLQQLLTEPIGAKLETSKRLCDGLHSSLKELEALKSRLDAGKPRSGSAFSVMPSGLSRPAKLTIASKHSNGVGI